MVRSLSKMSKSDTIFPAPRMADGRLFTDYRPRCVMQYQYRHQGSDSSYAYRQHLIRSASDIMQNQRDAALQAAARAPCVKPYNQGTMLPESSKFVCNASTCKVVAGDPSGLGTGRNYGESPAQAGAREAFLSQQDALQARAAHRAAYESRAPDGLLPGASADLGLPGARSTVPSGAAPALF